MRGDGWKSGEALEVAARWDEVWVPAVFLKVRLRTRSGRSPRTRGAAAAPVLPRRRCTKARAAPQCAALPAVRCRTRPSSFLRCAAAPALPVLSASLFGLPLVTDPFFYAVAAPAVFLMGLSKSGFGAGFGSLAVPLMALACTVPQAAAIMMPLLLVMDLLGIAAFRREVDWKLLRFLLPWALVGVGVGTFLFRVLSPTTVAGIVGVFTLLFLAQRLLFPPKPDSPPPSRMAGALQGASARGSAQFTAHWKGGWQVLLRQLQAASAGGALPTGKDAFELQATLGTPQLDLSLPAGQDAGSRGTALQLRALKAELSGTLAQATLSLDGEARLNAAMAQQMQRLSLQTRLSGGLAAPAQWQVQLRELRLQAHDAQRPGPWTLQLAEPVGLTARSGPTSLTVEASAGQARLTGPAPGTVALRWQPARVVTGSTLQLQTQGSLLRSLGAIETVLECLKYPVQYVAPRSWKKAFALGSDKTKALETARRLYIQELVLHGAGGLQQGVFRHTGQQAERCPFDDLHGISPWIEHAAHGPCIAAIQWLSIAP